MDENASENEPAGAQAVPNTSFMSIQTSPAPDPPSVAWDTSLPRRPTSQPTLELPAENMVENEKAKAPKKQRSIANFATKVAKDPKGTWKRMRRSKSTTTIATSPPPVEKSSPEALRSDKPEENPSEPQPQRPWIDPSDMKGPMEEDKNLHMGRPPGAAQRSNLAAFFWSRLELAHSLFRERRLDECRDLILENLEKAHVPLACRCQLLQQLAVIEPFDHGMECLEEADELCRQMRRIVPDSEQLDQMEDRTSRFRGLLKERHKATGEDEETAEGDDNISEEEEEEEMAIEDDNAIEEDEDMIMDEDNSIEAMEEPKESQGVQQKSEMEEGLGDISNIGKLSLDDTAEDTLLSLLKNAPARKLRRMGRKSSARPPLGLMTPEASMHEAEDEADQGQADQGQADLQ